MKKLFLIIAIALAITSSHAQQVLVRNVTPVDVNTIPYPNLAGNTTSSQPHKGTVMLTDGSSVKGKITFYKKKDVLARVKVNTGDEKREIEALQIASIALDPIIYEKQYPNNFKNPEKNFQPGYIILSTGQKLAGKVAQLRDFSDYDFFTYTILFLPDGHEVASTFKGGLLSEFGQEIAGSLHVWDGYADGYVFRMVDGPYRLSRNPYSKTKNEFFTVIKNQVMDSLTKQTAQAALAKSLKDGKNLNESIENAANAGSVVGEVLGAVEINKKEYLIFDTRTKSVTSVNKESFHAYANNLRSTCPGLSTDLPAWDKIEEFFRLVNANCN